MTKALSGGVMTQASKMKKLEKELTEVKLMYRDIFKLIHNTRLRPSSI
jgi:hypothetical protein